MMYVIGSASYWESNAAGLFASQKPASPEKEEIADYADAVQAQDPAGAGMCRESSNQVRTPQSHERDCQLEILKTSHDQIVILVLDAYNRPPAHPPQAFRSAHTVHVPIYNVRRLHGTFWTGRTPQETERCALEERLASDERPRSQQLNAINDLMIDAYRH